MDITKLRLPYAKEWHKIMEKRGKRKSISKSELLVALESGAPIPPELNSIMAQIVRGEFQYRYQRDRPEELPLPARVVARMVENLKADIENPPQGEDGSELRKLHALTISKHRAGKKTALQLARDKVAEGLGISERRVKECCWTKKQPPANR